MLVCRMGEQDQVAGLGLVGHLLQQILVHILVASAVKHDPHPSYPQHITNSPVPLLTQQGNKLQIMASCQISWNLLEIRRNLCILDHFIFLIIKLGFNFMVFKKNIVFLKAIHIILYFDAIINI